MNIRIRSYQCETVVNRMGDENTVERIFVDCRKIAHEKNRGIVQGMPYCSERSLGTGNKIGGREFQS